MSETRGSATKKINCSLKLETLIAVEKLETLITAENKALIAFEVLKY